MVLQVVRFSISVVHVVAALFYFLHSAATESFSQGGPFLQYGVEVEGTVSLPLSDPSIAGKIKILADGMSQLCHVPSQLLSTKAAYHELLAALASRDRDYLMEDTEVSYKRKLENIVSTKSIDFAKDALLLLTLAGTSSYGKTEVRFLPSKRPHTLLFEIRYTSTGITYNTGSDSEHRCSFWALAVSKEDFKSVKLVTVAIEPKFDDSVTTFEIGESSKAQLPLY